MSDLARDAGMITRYEIQCQSMSCKQTHALGSTNRRECAYEARRAGWQCIRGAWYCAGCAKGARR